MLKVWRTTLETLESSAEHHPAVAVPGVSSIGGIWDPLWHNNAEQ
jgi:hypothetical protein